MVSFPIIKKNPNGFAGFLIVYSWPFILIGLSFWWASGALERGGGRKGKRYLYTPAQLKTVPPNKNP